MANTPEELHYHPEHAWARSEDGRVRVGVTDYAQDELDTVVFVDLPELQAGLQQGQPFGEIESTKTVKDLVSPVSGTVVERNETLQGDPERPLGARRGEGSGRDRTAGGGVAIGALYRGAGSSFRRWPLTVVAVVLAACAIAESRDEQVQQRPLDLAGRGARRVALGD